MPARQCIREKKTISLEVLNFAVFALRCGMTPCMLYTSVNKDMEKPLNQLKIHVANDLMFSV